MGAKGGAFSSSKNTSRPSLSSVGTSVDFEPSLVKFSTGDLVRVQRDFTVFSNVPRGTTIIDKDTLLLVVSRVMFDSNRRCYRVLCEDGRIWYSTEAVAERFCRSEVVQP